MVLMSLACLYNVAQKPWQRADYDWGESGWSNGPCNSAAGACLLCTMLNTQLCFTIPNSSISCRASTVTASQC